MNNEQIMINQINGIINLLVEEDKQKLPESFKNYYSKKATVPPEKAIDFSKELKEQDFIPETKIMLVYLNYLLKKA